MYLVLKGKIKVENILNESFVDVFSWLVYSMNFIFVVVERLMISYFIENLLNRIIEILLIFFYRI